MSLLIAHVTPSIARIAVDTASASARDNTASEACKLLPIAHLQACIAVIGNLDLLAALFQVIAAMRGDFDDLSDAIVRDGIVQTCASAVEQVAIRDDFRMSERQMIVLVGWSPARQAMRGLLAERVTREAGFRVVEFGHVVAPPIPDEAIVPDSVDMIAGIAERQVAHIRETIPECPIGGKLIIVEIARDRISIDSSRVLQ